MFFFRQLGQYLLFYKYEEINTAGTKKLLSHSFPLSHLMNNRNGFFRIRKRFHIKNVFMAFVIHH